MIIQNTIPDDMSERVLSAFTKEYNYQEMIGVKPNPESREDFVSRQVAELIAGVVRKQEFNEQLRLAIEQANNLTPLTIS
jgi:hypothetical protein